MAFQAKTHTITAATTLDKRLSFFFLVKRKRVFIVS